jgi:penicillin-binding protein 2
MTSDSPRLRFAIVGIVTMSLIAALFARLWFLQVMTAPQYQVLAASDHLREVRTQAPRGRILDREGRVLVDNARSIEVTIDWQAYNKLHPPQQSALLARLAPVLNHYAQLQYEGQSGATGASSIRTGSGSTTTTSTSTTTTTTTQPGTPPTSPPTPDTVDSLRKRLNDVRFSHFQPIPMAKDVSPDLEIYLVEHASDFPTVSTEDVLVRHYPYGRLAAQLLGWVGPVTQDDLNQFQNRTKPYALTDEVGKSGIEREFEPELRGVPGTKTYEVNAKNQVVRELSDTPPIPGDDVYLSLDIRLQYLAEESLAAQIDLGAPCDSSGCPDPKTGSVVVTDPRNGQVLAMASYPTYDPNVFVGGISTTDYEALNNDPTKPLVNKAIGETYPAGSTWKLFTAYSGLSNGMITPDTPVVDTGSYHVNGCTVGKCVFYGAGHAAHGTVTLQRAISVSSDVYFYQLGDHMWDQRNRIGEDALAKTYKLWGFGQKTGSGLPGEFKGVVPSPAAALELAKALHKGDPAEIAATGGWSSGQNMNSAIGQGLVAITPLQLVNGYATFANGGTLYKPQLVLQVLKGFGTTALSVPTPQVVRHINLPPAWSLPLLAGFEGVTDPSVADSTAGTTFAGFPQSTFQVAGKTGTAQVQGKVETSLFVAFAPASSPQYAAVAILPEGGTGGRIAAPLIRRIFQPLAEAGGDMTKLPQVPLGGAFDVKAFEQSENISATTGID